MANYDEKTVHCLQAIIQELHELNKQIKVSNQLAVLTSISAEHSSERMEELTMKILDDIDLA